MGRSTKKGPWVEEALMKRVNAMNESGTITTVTVDEQGRVDALADGPGRGHRHGTLDSA